MKRKKYFLDKYKTQSEKKARGTEIIATVTARLRSGWNVWVKAVSTREHTPFEVCLENYRAYLLRSEEKKTMKSKTAYGYTSYLGVFCEWLQKRAVAVKYCYQIDVFLLTDFLDYILMDRESSARTRNNYLCWLSTLCVWMTEKGYLKEPPTAKIKKMREEPKKRNALSHGELAVLQKHLGAQNKYYLLACLMEYYTFIRPIELAQIKLEHIHIAEQKVFVPGSISKNKKDGMVGLNDDVIRLMIELHIFDHPGECYLFGKDFKPSAKPADSRIFREYFVKVREALHWDDSKQFYSLKDSGIRDLANAEGIVVARDQARHSDISTTNKYLKGDNLTVHEETKHFKGAFGKMEEPVLTDGKIEEKSVQEKREKPNDKAAGFDAQGEVKAVPKSTARAVKASSSPDIKRQSEAAQSGSAPKPTAEGVPPISESKANQARDFASLLKGKVGTKKKHQRIGQEKVFTSTDKGETTKIKGRPKPRDYSTSKK